MIRRRGDGTSPHDPGYPQHLLEFMRPHWRDSSLTAPLRQEAANHRKRREQLSAQFPGETLVIPSGGKKVRANDTHHPFRPGSDLLWLTGEQDPDAVLVMRPVGAGHDATLFVWPRSPRDTDEFFKDRNYGELWVGRRHTLAEKATELGIDTADLRTIEETITACANGDHRVLRGYDPTVDADLPPRDSGERDAELARVLSELRLVKDEWEIGQLQEAIDATTRGFEDVCRALPADRPVSERLVEGIFALRARHDGNDVGYGSIVGNGAHASILHWTRNDGTARPGDLLLMDMGVENRNFYTADVTRTVPVSGTFSPLQRTLYDLVYRSQRAGIETIAPGVPFIDVYHACMRVICEGLVDLGLLKVSVEQALDPEYMLHRRWTLHGSGHMLGIDVHDCAHARTEMYRDGIMREGYVLTVEPGLYFQAEDELVPAELRGIGIRIEDDVLVTASGVDVLSAELPTAPDEVESWLTAQRDAGPRLPG